MALGSTMPKAGGYDRRGKLSNGQEKVGEFVKEGEILSEIMTDKVQHGIEADLLPDCYSQR